MSKERDYPEVTVRLVDGEDANPPVTLTKIPFLPEGNGEAEKTIDLDDVLVNELGQFGKFQLKNILLLSMAVMLSSIKHDYNFTAATIPHRCRIPECGEVSRDSYFKPSWITNAIPEYNNAVASCERFAYIGNINETSQNCAATLFNRSHIIPCDEFVYANNKTIVYDFDLGCSEWLRVLSGTTASVGQLLTLLLTGYVADRYGRLITVILSLSALGLFGIIRSFSTSYPMFLVIQLIQTTIGAGSFDCLYILTTELVGPKYRVKTGAVVSSVFAVGQMYMATVAWLVQPWRQLLVALGSPCLLAISYYWFASESIRWLLTKKFSRAKTVLMKIAKDNGRHISNKTMEALMKKNNCAESSRIDVIKKILRSPILMKRMFVTPIWWATANLVYFGLNINSVGLSESKYFNYIIVCAVEIPAYIATAFACDTFGRKPTLASAYLFSAICNLAVAYIPEDYSILRLLVYLGGKFAISLVFSGVYMYTSELYPTEYRHTMFSFSASIGRIGSIMAPLTPALIQYWSGLPSLIFSGMAILSGLCIFAQPETLGEKLPDTLAEAEAIGTTNKTKNVIR